MASYVDVIIFALVGSVFSLAGGFLLLSNRRLANKTAEIATPFAAGSLLGAAFFDLLPESLEVCGNSLPLKWAAIAIVAFFILEHSLHWFHHHHEHKTRLPKEPTSLLVIIGDTVHNAIDGVAIGAAFLISLPTGIITTIAVAAHEIPQEIGDFGLLLKFGMKRRSVLIVNVLSSLATLVTALFVFSLGSQMELPLPALLGLTAGMFIYIAASDLLPRIHERSSKKFAKLDVLLLVAGLVIVALLTNVTHEQLEGQSEINQNLAPTEQHDESEVH